MQPTSEVHTITFGSCRKQRKPQSVWNAVSALQPDAWLWVGDYVYGGKGAATPEELTKFFDEAEKTEEALRAATRIIDGVYDDHDYGINDGGKYHVHKQLARTLFLDHVARAPADSPRRSQPGGLYGTRVLGVPPREVKVLMLDTRFARDDYTIPSVGGSSWLPKAGYAAGAIRSLSALLGVGQSHSGDMLGSEEQWRWLEAELTNSTAAAHILLSSVQVLTSSPIVESWGHFPRSRRRLLSLLAQTHPAGALLLSGDVHYAELLGGGASGLLEVTSSGLTHSCADSAVGKLMCSAVLQLFGAHRFSANRLNAHRFGSGASPSSTTASTSSTASSTAGASVGSFAGINFGSLEFAWRGDGAADSTNAGSADADATSVADSTAAAAGAAAAASTMTVRIHDVAGAVHLEHTIRLGRSSAQESARWLHALHGELPTIFDAAARLRAPVAGVALLGVLGVLGFTARARQRAARARRRAQKKAA